MEKFIEVHDNVLNPKLENLIESIILKKSIIPFSYQENLTFWPNHPQYKFKPGISYNLPQNPTHTHINTKINSILYNFCSYKGFIINEIINSRLFVDLPTPNPKLDTPPHMDFKSPHWVCLYYVNDSDGDTVFFKNDMKTEIKRVSPKKGRIAFFDGSILHAGTPSETNSRAVVNFNFTPYL